MPHITKMVRRIFGGKGSFSLAAIFFAFAGAMPSVVYGQLTLITNKEAQCAFAGDTRTISVTFNNPDGRDFNGQIRTRMLQAGSATAVLISEAPWRCIAVPSGETVLESASLNFPAVNAETEFLVQWLENSNHIIGTTPVWIYPTNLLQTLLPFVGVTNLGVFDPNNRLTPLLKSQGIEFADLGERELNHFGGKLAIIGPFESRTQMSEGLTARIETMARNNVAVVWILPPDAAASRCFENLDMSAARLNLLPPFYFVQKSRTAVAVVQPGVVAGLAANPRSQLNLIALCEQALYPKPMSLPDLPSP